MKITSIECLPVHSGWRKNFVFVRVETDAGVVGWGEAYSQYDRDRAVAAQVEELGRYLIGRDPFQIRHILQIAFDDYAQRRGSLEFYCATSGIEQALWDIVGKATEPAGLQSARRSVPSQKSASTPTAGATRCRSRTTMPARPRPWSSAASRAMKFDPVSGSVAHLHAQGAHPARREGDARGARCGRPRRRSAARHSPAPGADARDRSRRCAGGIRALLAGRAVPVGERRGAGRGPARAAGFRS